MRKVATVDRDERSASRFKKATWWLALLGCVFPIAFRQVSVSDAGSLGSELRWEWLGDMTLYFCYILLGSFGLQILVVACVLLASFFVIKSGSDRLGGWTLLLLVAVCLGTYQLQLPRNSLFSRWWRSYWEPSAWTRRNPLLLGISIWNSTGAPRFVNGWVARSVVD